MADSSQNARASTPETVFKKVKNNDKSVENEFTAADKQHSALKEQSHRIPSSITKLDVDDNDTEDSVGYAPDQDTIASGEDEPNNEYHAVQVLAVRKELEQERERDKSRKDALRYRELNRNKSWGSPATGKGPNWPFGNPDSKAEIIKHYSYWGGQRDKNETFAACWIELEKNLKPSDFVNSEKKGFFSELGSAVAGAALGAAREAVTNLGMAVSDQVANLENNTMNALDIAIDKALSPVLTPVSNFVNSVKDKVYGAIEDAAKFANDVITKSVLGVGSSTTKIKAYATAPYANQVADILSTDASTAAGYALKKEKVAKFYQQAIAEGVKASITAQSSDGSYGPLSQSLGSEESSKQNYKILDSGVLAQIADDYFVKPIMENGKSQGITDMPALPLVYAADSSSNGSYLAKPLDNSQVGSEENRTILDETSLQNTEYLENIQSFTEGNSEYFAAEVLQNAAKDANALAWEAAEVLCSTGKVMSEEKVMSIMDSTTNRFYVLDKVSSLFNKTTLGQQTMEAVNQYKPSQAINRFMLSQDSSNQGKGDVLLAATCLMEPQKKFEHTWNGTYLSKVKNLHTAIFKSPNVIGAVTGRVKNLCYYDEDDYINYYVFNGMTYGNKKFYFSQIEDETAPNVIKALMDVQAESSINDNNTFFNRVTGGIAGNNTDLAPKPLWHTMREDRKLYGEESLISMFRVNKTIPSGEVDYFQNGLYHLFFVKPDLNLSQNAMSLMGFHNHPLAGEIITQLNYNNNYLLDTWGENFPNPVYSHKGAHPYFSYILSNLVKSTSIPDLTLDVKEGWENSFGGRTQFGTTTRKSYIGNDFSINFYDTKELLIMNIITAWMKYIEIMKEGQGDCERKSYNAGTIDYLGALYYFVMEPDNHTIAHWGRYVGIFPTSAPWSNVKLEGGSMDIPEFSVNFKSQYHESNDPNILLDFNYIMRLPAYTGKSAPKADYIKYAELSSIYTSRGRRSTNDANLLGGATRSENRAYVRMTPSVKETSAQKTWGFQSPVPFKFLLEFESNMNGVDVDPKLSELAGFEPTNGVDPTPMTDVSEAQSSPIHIPTKEDVVKAATISPPNLYDPNAVLTYYDALGHKLGKEYGTGDKLGDIKWEARGNNDTDRYAIDSRYRVIIQNATIKPSVDGNSHGADQREAQNARGGLADYASSDIAGRVDSENARRTFGY